MIFITQQWGVRRISRRRIQSLLRESILVLIESEFVIVIVGDKGSELPSTRPVELGANVRPPTARIERSKLPEGDNSMYPSF